MVKALVKAIIFALLTAGASEKGRHTPALPVLNIQSHYGNRAEKVESVNLLGHIDDGLNPDGSIEVNVQLHLQRRHRRRSRRDE